ncbi:TonB-dependent receptor [Sediminitomix flava]|uniref:Outer membrane receptor for ferrienterochelin and colicin n=1 Tax=Sediminitomix flava TaxID=379075 RepID=A0A315ZBQ0_SEDFL|nr:TonB-dependent receptor [Sediminitomix flava]PWJ42503.1 outer membrane receptor for ferrienterochelin and colicin [Sediminitomix flava]
MKNQFFVLFLFSVFLTPITSFAQNGIIKGTVSDKSSNEKLPFVNVVIQGETRGASTNMDGYYEIKNLKPGLYNIEVSYVGYDPITIFEIEVTNARSAIADIQLKPSISELEEVEVRATGFLKTEESPVSVRTIGASEVKKNPGGNRDISRVIRSLPGVASTAAFRNDILIRGGSPNENRFYLDGIEVPNINHFATQGASGGPVGMINVDFIQNVDFYSGAFPVSRGNALSSVMEFKQKEGRSDNWATNLVLGTSDFGVTLDGPISQNSSLIFSARRSYLQFLFSALGLPFLPTYNDFQFKYTHKINKKNKISIIGLGAIDDFSLNEDAVSDPTAEDYESNKYILDYIPVQTQWNYTIGAKWEHFGENTTHTFVVSRNMLNNDQFKHENNDESLPKTLDYTSQEIENKLRWEAITYLPKNFNLSYGVNYELAKYTNATDTRIYNPELGEVVPTQFSSELDLNKWGVFANIGKKFFNKLSLSVGFRADGNDYSSSMENMFDQFSPRFSASYDLHPRWSLNFNTGIYYQLPPYTVLGYKADGEFVNRENDLTYIKNRHVVGGIEYKVDSKNFRASLEGFHKKYDNYPFSVANQVSLANLGGDFGVIGNEEVLSASEGRSYGLEFLVQQKFFRGFYGILAYTYVRSEFTDADGNFAPSSWDNRHIVSITSGKKLGKGWEIGGRWLYSGGNPYTPYDEQASINPEIWNTQKRAILDYSRVNSERLDAYHQLDIRVDKKYFFDKWSLSMFLDIQNIYNFKSKGQPTLIMATDENGNNLVDGNGNYVPKYLENENGLLQPSIGVIIEL